MKNIGKPCAGKPHARFDEGGLVSRPALYSTYVVCGTRKIPKNGDGEKIFKKQNEAFPISNGMNFEAIRQLIEVEEKPKRKIGFIAKEQHAVYRTTRKR